MIIDDNEWGADLDLKRDYHILFQGPNTVFAWRY